jgi:hypothetical protein
LSDKVNVGNGSIAQALHVLRTREDGRKKRIVVTTPEDRAKADTKAQVKAEREELLERLRGWVEGLPRCVVRSLAESDGTFDLVFSHLKTTLHPVAWACHRAAPQLPDRRAFHDRLADELEEVLQGDHLPDFEQEVLRSLVATAESAVGAASPAEHLPEGELAAARRLPSPRLARPARRVVAVPAAANLTSSRRDRAVASRSRIEKRPRRRKGEGPRRVSLTSECRIAA